MIQENKIHILFAILLLCEFFTGCLFFNGSSENGLNFKTTSRQPNDFHTSGDILWEYTGHGITSVAISSEGNYIVAGTSSNQVLVFDRSSSTPIWSYTINSAGVTVAISSNGQYIAAGNDKFYFFNKTYLSSSWNHLWNYTTSTAVKEISMSSNGNCSVARIDGDKIYFFNKTGYVWDDSSPGSTVTSVSMASNGQNFVVGSNDNKIYFYNTTGYRWNYTCNNWIKMVATSSDGNYTVAGSVDHKVYLFNSTNHLWNYTAGGEIVNVVAISSDGQYITAGTAGDTLFLFNYMNDSPLWTASFSSDVCSLAMSSSGQYIVAGECGPNVKYYNRTSTGTPLWQFYSSMQTINNVDISSDGQYIVAISNSGNLYLIPNSYTGPSSGDDDDEDDDTTPDDTSKSNQQSGDTLMIVAVVSVIGVAICIILIVAKVKSSKKPKIREDTKITPEKIDKLKKVIQVSNRIELDMVRRILELEQTKFEQKIIDWAAEFNLKIDGSYLIINQDSVDDFIHALDKQFETWTEKEKGKVEKKE